MSAGIPVIDLFAGPGGLGEGFSSVMDSRGRQVFRLATSIEKDPIAHRTLRLRAIFRRLKAVDSLSEYYAYVRGHISYEEFCRDSIVKQALQEADSETRCAVLGSDQESKIDGWIRSGIGKQAEWLLIGGPPCQAYSLAGRSRRTNDTTFEDDEKHFLYKEYLRIIRKFEPPVFVMENVKGILSSTHGGDGVFSRILKDLKAPRAGLKYDVRSFIFPSEAEIDARDYIVRAEHYGIPQARHRVILLGVRRDCTNLASHLPLVQADRPATVVEFLSGLPALRSSLSRGRDSRQGWLDVLSKTPELLNNFKHPKKVGISDRIATAIARASAIESMGLGFIKLAQTKQRLGLQEAFKWMQDVNLGGVCQHQSRGHMPSDLQRYLFAACYAIEVGVAPKLRDFPAQLLPNHGNAEAENIPFEDRFRVQLGNRPASTIVSHIAKDGHYYIHFDPSQCRSLTVREAARLQTFPENYFFEGNRTQQYSQVGNAVPPYLALQLGRSVAAMMGVKLLPMN